MSTEEKKSFTGSCHCGYIKYTFRPPIDPTTNTLTVNRCNCTFCQKLHTTNVQLPELGAAFDLLSPSSRAEIATYAPRNKNAVRYFCDKCGAHVWHEGFYMYGGQRVDIFTVNLATVDQPQPGLDVSQVKIKYYDGLTNNFAAGLKDSPWPSGML